MRFFLLFFVLGCLTLVALLGIRGRLFEGPPLEIFTDMKRQYKLKAQGENGFFAEGRNERDNPPQTIATTPDHLSPQIPTPAYVSDPVVATGKDADGAFHRGLPIPVTMETLQKGRERFDIYCAACHGTLGTGEGLTRPFGMNTVADLQQERIRQMPEGEIFNTITNGKGLMFGYKNRINTLERWQIIAYLRALQLSQNVTLEKLPKIK